ncbi:iron-siderophore ABC transporter permease [Paenibacillus sp. FSL H8-0548]|uniref:FecCD family ABC transporter permease n=1 Tax=Paenibacillus sp. FSL H8-0548 TaxID=1920422 RepID=UPI00096F02C3|nr:iron ABC transporter permease [Paenibacillus sp. FSL H8-0548]OMF28072.1 iron-siderophore ABC transporter permease [Paenibacillus sp. FSL H8-0548]
MKNRMDSVGMRAGGLAASVLLLLCCFAASVRFGFTTIKWEDLTDAFTDYDESSMEQVVVMTTRLPRALIAAAVGASLAMAGAIMQAITRNPLASPSVMGINAGASVGIVAAITIFKITATVTLVWISFGGAAIAAASVYLLGSLGRDGLSPLKIIMAGSAMTATFASLTQGMLVHNENGLQDVMFWLAGSIAGRDAQTLSTVIPYLCAGWVAAILLSRQLNIALMGDDAAKGLGQRTVLIKLAAGIIVVVLAGGAVSVAGPISLIGIVIPHVAKYIAGLDYRWLIPYSAILGAILLLLADLAARFVIFPEEVPVGIMTAAIGAPFFIYIARKELMRR